MISIRRYLLIYLTIALLISSIIIGIFTYNITGDELDELYNKNMQQISEVLLNQYNSEKVFPLSYNKNSDKLDDEAEFLIQIWQNNILIYSSNHTIKYPEQMVSGHGINIFEGRKWRYYNQSQKGITVQLSQPLDKRRDVIIEISDQFLMPVLLQIPILAFLIWIVVGRSLKPVEDISASIEKRDSNSLHPLSIENMPSEIKPLVNALNELLKRLDNTLKMQRNFTADAAHELRTPLTAIQLQLDLLKRSKSSKDKQKALEQLGDGIKRSIHVVRQLLSLANQEPKENEQNMELIDIGAIAANAVKRFTPAANNKHIKLLSSISTSLPYIKGNADSLTVMIDNILDNAVRYTPKNGKIKVSVSKTKENSLIVSISDNGCGIPQAERGRVFDRFYRITGTEESGTGLGLAIVKQIAENHNAEISLSSGLDGRGVCVIIEFYS